MRDLHHLTTGHISRDDCLVHGCKSHDLALVRGRSDRPWTRHTVDERDEERNEVVIQEDQDGDLGLATTEFIYVRGPTLKRSPNMKPTTTILGTLLRGS